jgi:hypothetical protein
MRKLLFLAGLLFTVSISAQNWQVRLRGVAVQPNEKSEVSAMGSLSMEQIGKGLLALAGSLVIIAVAMKLMTTALPGAAALLVVAIAPPRISSRCLLHARIYKKFHKNIINTKPKH